MNSQAVAEALAATVEALGLEIDRVETASAGKRSVLRVFLDGDGPEGRGPSLDEIAAATRAISVALDDSPAVGSGPYLLEVSSRGVSRPLTDPKHFRRNTGRLVALRLAVGERLTGRIVAADADGVRLEAESGEREVPYTQIESAVVQVELNRLPAGNAGDADDAGDQEE